MNVPESLSAWDSQRPAIRQTLWRLLGDLPPIFTPDVQVTARLERERYTIEKIAFDNGAGAVVFGYVLIPRGLQQTAPAVLYSHYHGGHFHLGKDEMFQDRVSVPPPGPVLVEAGFVVLAIDAYAFGERQTQGPAGGLESGRETEFALFKKFLWEGRTLWGMIVRDDLLALNYLCTRPDVDSKRLAATGMSLGASRTTWVSALDDRIALTIPVAQMTRYRDFADAGRMNGHSIYYYVPGALVAGIDMEHLASLVAPRAQIILIGDSDPLSPASGVRTVEAFTRQVYALYGAADRFQTVLYEGVDHTYTPAMFAAVMDGLRRFL
ncbi:MAG: dienelactone hydrolase [Anaerolineae bacterium]|nr:dienelactone hydrolase [Anaerolineae bacterium]